MPVNLGHAGGAFPGMPLPLSPIQILWINLVTDGLPGLALSVEPGEKDTMLRRPIRPMKMCSHAAWAAVFCGSGADGPGFTAGGFLYCRAAVHIGIPPFLLRLPFQRWVCDGNPLQRESVFTIGF